MKNCNVKLQYLAFEHIANEVHWVQNHEIAPIVINHGHPIDGNEGISKGGTSRGI
jgi:hypothetical protein